jgi:hypothetical protein
LIASSYWLSENPKCSKCKRVSAFPYLHWHGRAPLVLCGRCCREISHGFMADLIQVAAMQELHDTGDQADALTTKQLDAAVESAAEYLVRMHSRLRCKNKPDAIILPWPNEKETDR